MTMNPLDISGNLIDREKSSIFLHYLARATKKFEERQSRHKHKESSIEEKLENADVKKIAKHPIHEKIHKLEKKLHRYIETAPARKKRIEELERKVDGNLTRTDLLKEAISDLEILKEKYPKAQRSKITDKIVKLKRELRRLES